jgi:hypothetical protein
LDSDLDLEPMDSYTRTNEKYEGLAPEWAKSLVLDILRT